MLPTRALLKECLQVSRFSLLVGTAMLALFFCANDLGVAFVCVPVVLVIGIYNLKLLLQLIWRARKERESRQAIWRTGALMSLNIPVVALYTKLVLMLSNTLLVRLVNDTKQSLRHVVIVGCGEQRQLADLQPGQATILWLPISRACFERTVLVQYTAGKATQRAVIAWYVVEGKRINLGLGSGQQVAITTR